MKKTLSQKLADNLQHFTDNPNNRCMNKDNCYYSGATIGREDIEGCFIGKLLKPEVRLEIDAMGGMSLSCVIHGKGKDIKLPVFITKNEDVLSEFQSLHDRSNNWTEKGLSKNGVNELDKIIINHKLDAKAFDKCLPK